MTVGNTVLASFLFAAVSAEAAAHTHIMSTNAVTMIHFLIDAIFMRACVSFHLILRK